MKEKKQEQEKQKTEKASKSKKADEKVLQQKIDNLQKEKDELFEQLQRLSADYANFQKRVPKQIAYTISYEKETIIKTLLPALDNFEHTLQNAHSAEKPDILVKGIQIIYDQMLDILKSHGVEQIEATGQKFDPALHQALMRKADSKHKEDIVLEEFQKGYKLNDRVIRPSKVAVNKMATEEKEETQQQNESQKQDEKNTNSSEMQTE